MALVLRAGLTDVALVVHHQVLCLNENELGDRGVLGFLAPALQVAGGASRLQQLGLRQNARISPLGRAALQQAATHFNSTRATSFPRQTQRDDQLSITFS